MELKRINDERQAAAVDTQIEDNADLVADGQIADEPLTVPAPAVHGDCNPFLTIKNPGPFVVNPSDTEKQITIKKFENAQNLALYFKYANIEAAVCLLLRELFLATLFYDLDSSVNPVRVDLQVRVHGVHERIEARPAGDAELARERPSSGGGSGSGRLDGVWRK